MVTLSFGLMDEYDIEESFAALDEDKLGRLSIDQAYTLLLGLGYLKDYKQKDSFTPADLEEAVRGAVWGDVEEDFTAERVSLKTLLKVVEKFPSLLQRERSENLAHGFQLVDADQKGFVAAVDIQRLAGDAGESLSAATAQAMMEASKQFVSSSGNPNANHGNDQNQLGPQEFRRLFAPPSP